jgi:hypothetical protein
MEYLFSSRKKFCPSKEFWWVTNLDTESFLQSVLQESDHDDDGNDNIYHDSSSEEEEEDHHREPSKNLSSCSLLLRDVPFVIPFEDRVLLFRRLIEKEKQRLHIFDHPIPNQRIVIRRDHVFEDGFAKINSQGTSNFVAG